MGREMPKKLRMAAPSYLENPKEDDVVDGDAAREGAKDFGRGIADQAEKDQGGAERVNQRQEHAERDEKCFPDQQESSPMVNVNASQGSRGRGLS